MPFKDSEARKKYYQQWREKNLEKKRAYDRQYSAEHKENYLKLKAEGYFKKYYEKNKERHKASVKSWKERNPEKVKEIFARWYHRHSEREIARATKWGKDNPIKKKATKKAYWDRNKEEINAKRRKGREDYPEKVREYGRNYYKKNKSHLTILIDRSRAKRNSAPGQHVDKEWKQVLKDQGYLCFYCQCFLGDSNTSRDHKIPLCRGGSNGIENIVAACLTCNKRKRHMTAEEFIERRNVVSVNNITP